MQQDPASLLKYIPVDPEWTPVRDIPGHISAQQMKGLQLRRWVSLEKQVPPKGSGARGHPLRQGWIIQLTDLGRRVRDQCIDREATAVEEKILGAIVRIPEFMPDEDVRRPAIMLMATPGTPSWSPGVARRLHARLGDRFSSITIFDASAAGSIDPLEEARWVARHVLLCDMCAIHLDADALQNPSFWPFWVGSAIQCGKPVIVGISEAARSSVRLQVMEFFEAVHVVGIDAVTDRIAHLIEMERR